MQLVTYICIVIPKTNIMKTKLLTVLFSFVVALANAQTKADTLTNEKVIKLSKIGLAPSVIINKIHDSYSYFDVSTDGLIKLSENGVSPDVINEMQKTNTQGQISVANQKDMRDPKTKRTTGIYYYNPNDKEDPLKQVDPTVTSTNKSGGFGTHMAQSMTYGLAKSKEKSSLSGAKSHLQIVEKNPIFYFYFESNANPGADSWFFATATSPNEFVLVELDEKRDSREMAVSSSNAYGGTSGISNKIKVPFDYVKVAEGIYKVTFKQPLEQGEYCFLYASTTPTRYSNNKVFDFGVLNTK